MSGVGPFGGSQMPQLAPHPGILGCSSSSGASGDNFMLTHFHTYVMKGMIRTLLPVVALKYQANPNILFRENPVPVCCFVLANCFYWPIMAVITSMTATAVEGERFDRANHAALALGLLAAISELAMFLPHPVSVVPLIIWMVLTIVLAWPELCHAYVSLKDVIKKIADWINERTTWAEGEA